MNTSSTRARLATGGSLEGKFLIAMPSMSDPRFARTVIYLCAHSPDGAMGLVINRLAENITFPQLLDQLGIDSDASADRIRVHFGGPVETSRGFVLHSDDYQLDSSLGVGDSVSLTATVDILRAMVDGQGPSRVLFALGYAGWGAGQLDAEIQANGWLTADADPDILFSADLESKWNRAIAQLGFDVTRLSGDAGHA